MRLASGQGVVLDLGGAVLGVVGIDFSGDRISELNLVVNPAKLRRVPVAPDAYDPPHEPP